MKVRRAIDIVARQLLANAAVDIEWEFLPDMGQDDFMAVAARMAALSPDQPKFNEAIALLEGRAAQWERENQL